MIMKNGCILLEYKKISSTIDLGLDEDKYRKNEFIVKDFDKNFEYNFILDIGDIIIAPEYIGEKIEINDKEYKIIRQEHILAINN